MRKFLKFVVVFVVLIILVKMSVLLFVEPWVAQKIQTAVNKPDSDYRVEIGKAHVLLFRSGLTLNKILINSANAPDGRENLSGEIAEIKFSRINLFKIIFNKSVQIHELNIDRILFTGMIPPSKKPLAPLVSPLNIRIDRLTVNGIDLALRKSTTPQAWSLNNGTIKANDLQCKKLDTLNISLAKGFIVRADGLGSVSPDSLYTYLAYGVEYNSVSHLLRTDSLLMHPNYPNYKFTAQFAFQTARIDANLSNTLFHDFQFEEFIESKKLTCRFVEISNMDIVVFKDQRKEIRHISKTTFQDLIYQYPGYLRIDSIQLYSGDVRYTAHALKATEPGHISFNDIHAKISKITNDTIYKQETGFMELHADALLMRTGKLAVVLKAGIFDRNNTFSLIGHLSAMEGESLNPILEKNAFMYVTSGTIDKMNFDFTANNQRATGDLTLLYHGLDLAVKNKRTNDTTAIVERIISFVVNRKIPDSNPLPGHEIRVGIINHERDPERFLFGYAFRSILSGMKSSLVK